MLLPLTFIDVLQTNGICVDKAQRDDFPYQSPEQDICLPTDLRVYTWPAHLHDYHAIISEKNQQNILSLVFD